MRLLWMKMHEYFAPPKCIPRWCFDEKVFYSHFIRLWFQSPLLAASFFTSILFLLSLSHGLSIFQEGKGGGKDTIKLEVYAETSKVSILVVELENTGIQENILCPCKRCKNGICLQRENVEVHLRCVGFTKGYTQCTAHGETSNLVH